MTKVLHSHDIQKNGEEIKVEVVETELGIEINVNGVEVKVNVNGETYYEKYDKEEFKYIPVNLRKFVSEHGFDYFELQEKNVPHFYIYVQRREFACHIVTLKNKRYLTMRDWLVDVEKVKEKVGLKEKEVTELNENLESLKKFIVDKGYTLHFSHDGDEFDTVHYLDIPVENFDEKKVEDCIAKWTEHNDLLKTYIK